MPRHRKYRYVGWMVCRSDLRGGTDRKFARAKTEADAREMVQRLNAQAGPEVLFWCEFWSTSSSLAELPAPSPRNHERFATDRR